MGWLAKARVLKVINFREEDIPTLRALEKILKRDGTDFSEWARKKATEYVKAHAEGNDVIPLNKFAEQAEFFALPTIGEPLPLAKLDKLDDSDFELLEKTCEARYQEIAFARKWRDDRWRRTP